MTPIINGILERCLTGLVDWQHNTSDDETATRLMYGVFQTQVRSPRYLLLFLLLLLGVVVLECGDLLMPPQQYRLPFYRLLAVHGASQGLTILVVESRRWADIAVAPWVMHFVALVFQRMSFSKGQLARF